MAVGGVLVGRLKGAVRHVCAAVECARGLALPAAGGSRPTLALQVDARLRAQLWRTAQVMALGFCMTLPMLLVQADLKNRAAWHEAHPLGRPPLNLTLPDALLDRWPSLDMLPQSVPVEPGPDAHRVAAAVSASIAPSAPASASARWPQQQEGAGQGRERVQTAAPGGRRARVIDRLWLLLFLSTLALIACDGRRRHRTLRRMFMQFASMYLLRCFTLPWTILPKTDPLCQNASTSTLGELLFDMVQNVAGQCHDFMFSGHTGTTVVLVGVWLARARHWAARVCALALGGLVLFYISYDRLHYTVDIVLGLIITSLLLAVHHLLARLARVSALLTISPTLVRVAAASGAASGAAASAAAAPGDAAGGGLLPPCALLDRFALPFVRWVDGADLDDPEPLAGPRLQLRLD